MSAPLCERIDRIAPTLRPDLPLAGTQRSRDLLFLHWSFPREQIRALVPPSLELDCWDGRAWIGLVPFVMQAVRSSWMPRSTGLSFLETNVRTYVHRRGEPGVYFFSLEASSWLAVRVARLAWGLPYFHASMTLQRAGDAFVYRSRRRGHGDAALEVHGSVGALLGASPPDTLEHFLLERYLLFATRRGALLRGQVHHTPYPAQRVDVTRVSASLLAAAGVPAHAPVPECAHYASGVDVEVFGPDRINDPS